jgi:hypothetical protein
MSVKVGGWVYLPNRVDPGHPGYKLACEVFGTPGQVVSIVDGWAMVDRGSWGQFGCSVDDLRPAGDTTPGCGDKPGTRETFAILDETDSRTTQ